MSDGAIAALARIEALDAEYDDVLDGLEVPDLLPDPDPDLRTSVPRTLALGMEGSDVRGWQRTVNIRLDAWAIEYAIGIDGDYGEETERWSKRVLHGLGLSIGRWAGVTPQARIKARHPRLRSPEELTAARARRAWVGAATAKCRRAVRRPRL